MIKTTSTLITIALVLAILILGESILIPFVFALLIWFITRVIRKLIYKIDFIEKYIPKWMSNILVFGILISAIAMGLDLVLTNINQLSVSVQSYRHNFKIFEDKINEYFNIDIGVKITEFISSFDFSSVLGGFASGISGLLSSVFMIMIYALFIFLEESSFVKKISKVFTDKTDYEVYNSTMIKIENSISNYLILKSLVSLLTGFLSYIVLIIIGLEGAAFWAFLIFVLNFVPTVGSLIATLFPAVFSVIQFGTFTPLIAIILGVGLIQLLVGNIIEPRLFGKSLNISPLISILALAIWGQIWGITGMILSVPIMVIMVIVMSEFESTRPIALMLSENGDIDDNTV